MRIHTDLLEKMSYAPAAVSGYRLHKKYRDFTMITMRPYVANLLAASLCKDVAGCVVECGVWRGGMSAGIAEVLGPDRNYYLFDSFEGLPPAKAIDGAAALEWQADKNSPSYHNNCAAEQSSAEAAMKMSGAKHFRCIKGWFNETLPQFVPESKIALLRIDADWYDSVLCCLENLHKHLAPNALIVLDDYQTWDGCSKAVHRFLADTESTMRVDRVFGYVNVLNLPRHLALHAADGGVAQQK